MKIYSSDIYMKISQLYFARYATLDSFSDQMCCS